ncbi:hypothetical protein SVTN_04870 [Streptomyces vietnamensis]|uniref:Uncharacterized protein n=1 Tax=Streptomyces vietnamensis TaxID=362257 RepID=A0A0B5I2L9_9ACTN|nr:hypothetical protein SVTN_04870 [Streptomyces vietnamensis]
MSARPTVRAAGAVVRGDVAGAAVSWVATGHHASPRSPGSVSTRASGWTGERTGEASSRYSGWQAVQTRPRAASGVQSSSRSRSPGRQVVMAITQQCFDRVRRDA